LTEYDPGLASVCEEIFGKTELVYTKPITRLKGHLAGYNPTNAAQFQWPERLQASKEKIREAATKQGADRKREYKN
jgi:hypothetical protein